MTCCRRFRKRPRIKTRCSDLRRQLGGFSRVQFGTIAVGVGIGARQPPMRDTASPSKGVEALTLSLAPEC